MKLKVIIDQAALASMINQYLASEGMTSDEDVVYAASDCLLQANGGVLEIVAERLPPSRLAPVRISGANAVEEGQPIQKVRPMMHGDLKDPEPSGRTREEILAETEASTREMALILQESEALAAEGRARRAAR